jgi:C-terminal processing protease CtpA/Prc
MIHGVFLTSDALQFPEACGLHGGARTGPKAIPDCIHFFDAADVGLKLSDPNKTARPFGPGLLVAEAVKDSLFASAGLQAEDLIVKVGAEDVNKDGHYASGRLSFNRLLRRELARWEEFTLTVKRDDKVLELTVPAKD